MDLITSLIFYEKREDLKNIKIWVFIINKSLFQIVCGREIWRYFFKFSVKKL